MFDMFNHHTGKYHCQRCDKHLAARMVSRRTIKYTWVTSGIGAKPVVKVLLVPEITMITWRNMRVEPSLATIARKDSRQTAVWSHMVDNIGESSTAGVWSISWILCQFMPALIEFIIAIQWKCWHLLDTKRPQLGQSSTLLLTLTYFFSWIKGFSNI